MGERPLVFVSCGAATLPVIPHLAPRYDIVVPDPGIAAQLNRQKIAAIDWTSLADRRRLSAVTADAARLTHEWRAALADDPGRFAFGGRTRAAVVLPAMEEILRTHLTSQLVLVECGRALGASGRLAAAVVHDDVTSPVRAFLDAMRPFGVATVHVPHGLYAEERMVDADVHGAVHTDVVAVAGSVQRDWFLRRGVPPARLAITGSPAWDHLCHQPRLGPEALGLRPGPVVTLATSWISADSADHAGSRRVHERQTVAMLRAVTQLQARDPRVQLVLKLHPSTPPAEETHLLRLASQAGTSITLCVRDRVAAVLAASDVLLTLPSTIAVEALVVGTPVIAPEFFYEGDAVRTVPADPEAIGVALEQALAGLRTSAGFARHRREFLARYNGPCDGRAAERVVAVVEDLVARTRARRSAETAPTLGTRLASARALAASGRPADALALLETGPTAADPPALEAERLALRGEALSRLGRATDAEQSFRAALAAGAGVRAMAGLGLALIERGAHDEAEDRLREALALDASCDWGWCGLGVLQAIRGNVAEAVPLLERALALNPANGDARNALAVLTRAGDGQGRVDAG